MKELEQIFESFKPVTQFIITCLMGVIGHLGIITSIVALVVLIFQFKVVYYNGKLKKLEFDKKENG
ncbi:MAG: hypothetical protein GY857_19090 [Desulfobacula sp.]|nr:hypothetical protein [Desulfobacula sp.]